MLSSVCMQNLNSKKFPLLGQSLCSTTVIQTVVTKTCEYNYNYFFRNSNPWLPITETLETLKFLQFVIASVIVTPNESKVFVASTSDEKNSML